MKKLLMSVSFLLCLVSLTVLSVNSQTFLRIYSDGEIIYPMMRVSALVHDSFEITQVVDGKLKGWPDHEIEEPENISFSSAQAHTGSKSLAITRGGGGLGTRVFLWRDYNEYWMSQWLYFSSSFDLTNWFSFGNPIYEWIEDGTTLTFELEVLGGNDLNLYLLKFKKSNYAHEAGSPQYFNSNMSMPRDQWVNIKCHVIRDEVNGLIDIYMNDQLVIHYVGETRWQQDKFMVQPIKFYCGYDPADLIKTLYFDDIEIWIDA